MLRRIMLAAFALSVVTVAPAAAHTDLTGTNPRDGQSLRKPPAEITLTFGEDLLDGGDKLVAKDADGTPVALGQPRVDGPVLSADWPKAAADGTYTVSYRAVASDGHPLQGKFSFTVTAPKPASPSASAPGQAPPTAEPAAAQTTATNPWLIAGPALLIVVLAAAGFFVWRSRE